MADEADSDGADHIAWGQSDTGGRFAVHSDLQLGESGELFGPQISDAPDLPHHSLGLLGQARQLVEIRPEDPHREIGRRTAETFVDTHSERGGEQHRDAGHLIDPRAHVVLDLLERT